MAPVRALTDHRGHVQAHPPRVSSDAVDSVVLELQPVRTSVLSDEELLGGTDAQ